MTGLDDATIDVDVLDILVGCGITQEDPAEVVMVEFGLSFAGAFSTDAGAKDFETRQVGFDTVIAFKGGTTSLRMDKTVV